MTNVTCNHLNCRLRVATRAYWVECWPVARFHTHCQNCLYCYSCLQFLDWALMTRFRGWKTLLLQTTGSAVEWPIVRERPVEVH